uniref:Nose resistant to fluoxetine protein 6 n=1 Tax=Ceratitis capitata TaxID=7213 RepID=W8AX02_CERCA
MCSMIVTVTFVCTLIITPAIANDICTANALPRVPASQRNLHETFQRTSLLYGLSTIGNEYLIKQECQEQLQLFQLGVRTKMPWAVKMFDASASLEPGFTFGHNFWLGNSEICSAVSRQTHVQISTYLRHQMKPELLTEVAPFNVDFRVLYLRHNSSWQVDAAVIAFASRLHVGLCLPSACTAHEVQQLVQAYLSTDLNAANEFYEMNLQYDYAKDLKLKSTTFRRTSFYLTCFFLATTIALTVAASLLRKSQDLYKANANIRNSRSTNGNVLETTNTSGATIKPHKSELDLNVTSFIACFDFDANWLHVFAPAKAEHTFTALNGLRFGSAICVTVYHYLMFLFHGTRNKVTLYNYQAYVGNVDIFVDIFFTISGFLQAFNHFRNVKLLAVIRQNSLKQNFKLMGLHLFHRYLRLAPLYFLTIGLSDFGSKLLDDISVFHIEHKVYANCEKYWWRNVLLIQNFFDHNDMCGLWTWSLACDMQFSILATVLLFLYVKHPKRTKLCLAALTGTSIAYTYTFGLKLNFDQTIEATFTFLTEIYTHPFARILAYMCGGIAGWYFVVQKPTEWHFTKQIKHFFDYLVALVFFGCIFMPTNHNFSVFTSTTILLLERFIFTATSCILILSNAHGRMRWFFRFFETIFFQKFNRVAYAMFLINPIVVFALPGFSRSNLYANPLSLFAEFIGLLVILVLLSTLLTLLFDIPYQNLSRLLIQYQMRKKVD